MEQRKTGETFIRCQYISEYLDLTSAQLLMKVSWKYLFQESN